MSDKLDEIAARLKAELHKGDYQLDRGSTWNHPIRAALDEARQAAFSEPFRVFCEKHSEHKPVYTDGRPLLDDTCARCKNEEDRAEIERLRAGAMERERTIALGIRQLEAAEAEIESLTAEVERRREQGIGDRTEIERLRAEAKGLADRWEAEWQKEHDRAEAAEAKYRDEIKRGDDNYLRATRAEAKLAEAQEACAAMSGELHFVLDLGGRAKLLESIDRAIQRITSGHAPMRIPAVPDGDADLVLSRCRTALEEDRAEIERLRAAEAKFTALREQNLLLIKSDTDARHSLETHRILLSNEVHIRQAAEDLLTAERAMSAELMDAIGCGGRLDEPCLVPAEPCWEHELRAAEAKLARETAERNAAEAEFSRLLERGNAALAENERLAAEHTQCHDWNGRLVHEHYELRAEIERLREDNAALQKARQDDGVVYLEQRAEIERMEKKILRLEKQVRDGYAEYRDQVAGEAMAEIERLRHSYALLEEERQRQHDRAEAAEAIALQGKLCISEQHKNLEAEGACPGCDEALAAAKEGE